MKKITFLLLITMSLFVVNSCKDRIGGGTEDIDYVSFEKAAFTVVVNKNSTASQDITIYTTQISGSDRVFNLSVAAATTADAGAYTVPSTVTVPANSNSGVLTVGVADVNIAATGVKLVLAFAPSDGLFAGSNVTVTIQRFCPLVIQDFLGEYNITEKGYGTYPTTITLDPTVANRIWVTNFWDWTNDLAYYDFHDDGTVTMPSQVIVMGDGGSYTCVGSGTYNACAGTFHMTYSGDVAGTVHDFAPRTSKASSSINKRKGM